MDATITIQKMMDYFNVSSIQDLAQKMNVSQPTISKWKNRNAISAVKKRCRELGIYNEIFADLNLSSNSYIYVDEIKQSRERLYAARQRKNVN